MHAFFTPKKIYDQHVHSYYSVDCEEPLINYINYALKIGVDALVFTNHIDFDYPTIGDNWMFNIEKEHQEINKYQKEFTNIHFLYGIEIGFHENHLDEIKHILADHYFDVVNFSMHLSYGIDYYSVECVSKLGCDYVMEKYFDSMVKMVNSFNDYDVLCHIDYGFKTVYMIDNTKTIDKYEKYLRQIFSAIINNDKTLEINTKVQDVINNPKHLPYLLNLYKEMGGKNITISSDSHNYDWLCRSFEKYIPVIKQCGFDHLCYFIGRKRYEFKI